MKKELRLTDANFKEEVLDSEVPVLVDFWASWCPPCKMIEPVMDELANQLDGTIKVRKLNVDQNPATRSMFNISAAPTFVLFNNGQIVQRIIGARSKKQLMQMIETALASQEPMQEIKTITGAQMRGRPTDVLEKA